MVVVVNLCRVWEDHGVHFRPRDQQVPKYGARHWRPLNTGVFGRRRKARVRSDNAVWVLCAILKNKHLIFRIMGGF